MRSSLRRVRHMRMSMRSVRVGVAGAREVLVAALNFQCQLE